MDVYKAWLAFLSSVIIERCQQKLTNDCDACKAGLKAPILHFHNHFNLLDVMKKYTVVVISEMDITNLFNIFIVKFGFFEAPEEEFVKTGEYFIKFSSAEAIYYGNYITKEHDEALYVEVSYDVPTYNPSTPNPTVSMSKATPAKKQCKSAEIKTVRRKKKET